MKGMEGDADANRTIRLQLVSCRICAAERHSAVLRKDARAGRCDCAGAVLTVLSLEKPASVWLPSTHEQSLSCIAGWTDAVA